MMITERLVGCILAPLKSPGRHFSSISILILCYLLLWIEIVPSSELSRNNYAAGSAGRSKYLFGSSDLVGYRTSSQQDPSDHYPLEPSGAPDLEHPEMSQDHDYHPVQEFNPASSNDNQQNDILLSTESLNQHHKPIEPDTDTELDLPKSHPLSDNSNQYHRNRPTKTYKEYLTNSLAERACKLDRGCQRKDRLNNTYLNYCTRYKLENLFSNQILMSIMHDSSNECERILEEFILLDELIFKFYELFRDLLTRYNCHNGYSVKWSCEDCKKAYQDWLCATSLPYYMNGEHVKPCISFCERVEQRCPYLHPITKEQYGGQPVFICRDPNIPFVPEITPDIPYSEPSKCYDLCHLSQNRTELVIDSLSKYDPDKCPDRSMVAEQVRNDIYCPKPLPSIRSNDTSSLEEEEGGQHSLHDGQTSHNSSATRTGSASGSVEVHKRKLDELQEVLAVYKRQPETHKFGQHSDHR